jgi:hypothetical protein
MRMVDEKTCDMRESGRKEDTILKDQQVLHAEEGNKSCVGKITHVQKHCYEAA